jgi:predicted amidohydrolase
MKSARFFIVILLTSCFLTFSEATNSTDVNLRTGHQPFYRTSQQNSIFIALEGAANMGFYDSVSGDNKGGWTDFGPNACLKNIPSGVQTFQDGLVPFKIIDPDVNHGKSVIVLNGPRRETTFPVLSPKIPVNRKLQELYFLHTTMYAETTGDFLPLVKYKIHYSDGSEQLLICYKGLEIDDWWDPSPRMPRAVRTYNEKMTWLINTPWLNPLPDKTIEWIQMESTGNAIPILVAISGTEGQGPHHSLMSMINERIENYKTGILRIAVVQPAKLPDQKINLENGEEYCRQARNKGADIVVFPEMYNIGYSGIDFDAPGALEKWHSLAVSHDDEFVIHFRELARELNIAIHITYLERWEGLPRNSASLIDRHGNIVMTYAKVHTCDFLEVELHTTPGDEFVVADLDTRLGPVKVGSMICYDREHPESARLNMLKGAEVILTPNACNLYPMLLHQFQIRAFENALVTAMANYANAGLNSFNGHSCVFGADGEQKLLAGENEGIYVAEINLGRMREIREKTIYGNAYRRPHKYELITSPEVEKPFERKNTLGQPFKRLER